MVRRLINTRKQDAWDNYIQNTSTFNFPLSSEPQQPPLTSNDPLFSLNAAASAALQTPQQGKSNPYSWTPATNASYGSTQYVDTSGVIPTTTNSANPAAAAAAGLGTNAYQQQQQQQRMAPQAQMQAIAQQASGNMAGLDGFGNGEGSL